MLVMELRSCCCGRLPGFALGGEKDVLREYVQPDDAKAIEVFVFKFLSKLILMENDFLLKTQKP